MPVIQRAKREKVWLKIALAGLPGSGKTEAALKLATQISKKGVVVIDSERASSELYADRYDFDILKLNPPYTINQYYDYFATAEASPDHDVIIIDSLSHEWMAVLDAVGSVEKKFTEGWGAMSPMHEKLIDLIMHSKKHVIGTIRSKEKYAQERDSKGKTVVVKLGEGQIQRKGLEYEFSLCLEIDLQHRAISTKDRTGLFDNRPPFMITEQTGVMLAQWSEFGIKGVTQQAIPQTLPQPKQQHHPQQLAQAPRPVALATTEQKSHLRNELAKVTLPDDVKKAIEAEYATMTEERYFAYLKRAQAKLAEERASPPPPNKITAKQRKELQELMNALLILSPDAQIGFASDYQTFTEGEANEAIEWLADQISFTSETQTNGEQSEVIDDGDGWISAIQMSQIDRLLKKSTLSGADKLRINASYAEMRFDEAAELIAILQTKQPEVGF